MMAANFDPTDAGYIAAALFALTSSERRMLGEGELEDMGAMFVGASEAAQAVADLVHEDEYQRLVVFVYEVDWTDLAKRLFDARCENVRDVVRAWMKAHGLRGKDEPAPDAVEPVAAVVEPVEAQDAEDDETCFGCDGPLDSDGIYCVDCEDKRCKHCGEANSVAHCDFCTLTTI